MKKTQTIRNNSYVIRTKADKFDHEDLRSCFLFSLRFLFVRSTKCGTKRSDDFTEDF